MALDDTIAALGPALEKMIVAQARSARPDPVGAVAATRTPSGVVVTHEEALRHSTVWACVNVIAKSIASSDWDVFEVDSTGNRTPLRNSRQWWLLNTRPNEDMTGFAFRESMLLQALLYGNSYAEIERNNRGEAMALWPIAAWDASLERSRTTRGLQLNVRGEPGRPNIIIPYRDVFHLQGPSINGVDGLDPIAYASRTIGYAAAADTFSSAFYGNSASLGGVVSTDQVLRPEQMEELRSSIEARHMGAKNAGRFLILQAGLKFQPLAFSPEQAQFTETKYTIVEDVCRIFGVPPHKVQHLVRSSYNSVEQLGLEFVRDALVPWAERLAQEADGKLMPYGNRMMRTAIDLDWLTFGDAQSMASAHASLVGAGIITRNEARRIRGLNMRPEADELTVQAQYVPVGTTQAVRPPPTAPQPEAADTPSEETADDET